MKKIIFILLVCEAVIIHAQNADSVQSLINFEVAKFKYMLETAYNYHNDTIDVTGSSDKAFAMLMQSLDRESYYYDKDHYTKATEENKGISVGIGLVAVNFEDTLTVIEVKQGSPAMREGVFPGDRILSINGLSAEKMSKADAEKIFNGEIGQTVKLSVMKYNREIKNYEITRDSVEYSSISADFVLPGTSCAYIALNRFSSLSDIDFRLAAEKVLESNAKAIILDLRENPGGVLSKASAVADQFISGERVIAYTESRLKDFELKLYSKNGDPLEKTPVIVLIDKGSASGSEIVAGSIQDYDRGLIVGERSYGKGTVQKFFPMKDTTAIKLTVAEYHTPSGREIDKGRVTSQSNNAQKDLLELNLDSTALAGLKTSMNYTNGMENLPIYTTAKGRKIIGGGGIFPDYFVKADTLTLLTNVLKQRGFMLDWGLKYYYANYKKLEEKFKTIEEFNSLFQLTDQDLKAFENFSRSKNIWNDVMFATDKDYIATYIKAAIAYPRWGNNAFSAVLSSKDNYITKAIELMPKAEEMINN